jgi:hypothetical protein
MKRFGSRMVPADRSTGSKQSSPVNRPAAVRHKPLLVRRFMFAIGSLVVAAFLSPTAKTVVGKSFGSLYKPKLELLAAAFVVVQGEDLTNNGIRESTAIYDVRDHCLVSVFDSARPRSSPQPESPPGLLFSQAHLYNGGRSGATNLRVAFLFSLPGKVTIETTPNLTFTTQSVQSQFLDNEEIVTIARLPAGAGGIVTAKIAIPSSSFSLQTNGARSDSENIILNTNSEWLSGRVLFLGSDEVSQSASIKLISTEESIQRYATLTGIPELNLPIALPAAATGVSMHEYRVVDGGCAQASGAVHLTSHGIRVLSAPTN